MGRAHPDHTPSRSQRGFFDTSGTSHYFIGRLSITCGMTSQASLISSDVGSIRKAAKACTRTALHATVPHASEIFATVNERSMRPLLLRSLCCAPGTCQSWRQLRLGLRTVMMHLSIGTVVVSCSILPLAHPPSGIRKG